LVLNLWLKQDGFKRPFHDFYRKKKKSFFGS